MEFWFERNLGVGKHRDTSLIVEVPSDDWIGVPIPSNAAVYREVFHAACPKLLATLAERHQFKPHNIEPYLLSRS